MYPIGPSFLGWILMLILLTSLVSALSPQAEAGPLHELFRAPRKPGVLVPTPPSRRAEAPSPPTRPTGGGVVPVTCSADAQSAGASLCGYVMVPLNRYDPKQGTIGIYFEQYLHTSAGKAVSAVVVRVGGPGYTDEQSYVRGLLLSQFGANLDVHDLVLIDDRGRGLSDAIDCPDLQQGLVPFDHGVAKCAAQLGNAASNYGTGDIGIDTEAVRSALGYDQLDFYATSYAGEDLTAYATRFGGRHLRSIILDAPMGTPHLDEARFAFVQYDI